MTIKRIAPLFNLILAFVIVSLAETYTPEPSNRITINLGETPWKFTKGDALNAQTTGLNDAGWKDVGIPHCWNDTDTYINQGSGGGDGSMLGGICWYRKHFTLDNQYAGRKIFIEVEGAHVGAAAYINGTFIPGNSALNPTATHVIGFIGFIVDVTSSVQFGGADNVFAVRVGKSGGFYIDPGFSEVFRFGQEDGGLFRPVWMHITDKVHVPQNVYSVLNQWGTYVVTKTVAGDGSSATVEIQTNVLNESAAAQNVTLTTKVVDIRNGNNVVLSLASTQSIAAGQSYVFDQTGDVANPTLWYPNNSTYGTPYLYKVYHIVKVGTTTLDVFESPLGIRVITWDNNFPYFNGHKHLLFGGASRYDYPALGSAVSNEQEYRDAKLMAQCGGSLWRPGHSSCSKGFVNACDNYGVMLVQPSGDGENAFSATLLTDAKYILKSELHRDMIIRDRNNPSILAWEADNGVTATPVAQALKAISVQWDPVNTRAQADRTPNSANGDILSCTLSGCEIGVKRQYPDNPAWCAEAWNRSSARFAYDYEIAFAAQYFQNWRASVAANCFGIAQWYMADTPGEQADYLEGVTAANVRSTGTSMMDFNRFPKMLYKIYQAAWTPFSIQPMVSLAHHWNRSGTVRVNAFSNCPNVRLSLNGTVISTKTPNPATGVGNNSDLTQTTTQLPFQCYWDVAWAAGTLLAEGLDAGGNVVCTDRKMTAGNPDHIVLSVDSAIVKQTGEVFQIKANGSDAAFIVAKVVDAQGNLCPTDSHTITWSVSGPGNYRGGANAYVTANQPRGYHSPLDPQLNAEGGLSKVAVRSTFTPGVVTVTAASQGLTSGSASFTTVAPGTTGIRRPVAFTNGVSASAVVRMEVVRGIVRYFVEKASVVSMEILDASGRMVKAVSGSKQERGWHILPLNDASSGTGRRATGMYLVRCMVDGVAFVKRLAIVK
jgi:beta-galactosidase